MGTRALIGDDTQIPFEIHLCNMWIHLSAPHLYTYPAIKPYETIDSAGKITILGPGKATTRAKRRITAAL
jgi:hypothetical protein